MPIIATEGQKRDPVPEGVHHAVCYAVVDLGTQPPLPGSQFSKRQHKILVMFELPEERITYQREGVEMEGPRAISKDFALSLHEKAKLRAFLVSWRGRQFTPTELEGFDLKNVLGVNCFLNVVHNAKGYADIATIMPLKGANKMSPKNEVTYFALNELSKTDPLPNTLPQWVRDRIERSDEWQARLADEADPEANAPFPGDDDIPF